MTVRLDLPLPHARFWINGRPVAHGARVTLGHGHYAFAMETVLPKNVEGQLRIRPRVRPSDDVRTERRTFLTAVAADADLLRDAVNLASGTETGRRAKTLLDLVRR